MHIQFSEHDLKKKKILFLSLARIFIFSNAKMGTIPLSPSYLVRMGIQLENTNFGGRFLKDLT